MAWESELPDDLIDLLALLEAEVEGDLP